MNQQSSDSAPLLDIKLFVTPREATDDDLRNSTAIVVDVLRASSTIACALTNGAREIIPVMTPAEAGQLASLSGRGVSLLCGEREGRRIDGFDLGNSPLEYTAERVSGRILIFSSTNGTPAIFRARAAERVYVGGYNNFGETVERVIADGKPVAILCSGRMDQFAIEDFVCAGKFVNALETKLRRGTQLNDAARAAALLHRHFDGRIAGLMKSSQHGKLLIALGFEADIEYCARVDIHPVIPTLVEGKIKGFRSDGRPIGELASLAN